MVFLIFLSVNFNILAAEKGSSLIIEVFTSDSYPITGENRLNKQGIKIQHYNLDDGDRMVANKLEANLPKNQQAAEAEMTKRIKRIGQAALSKMFNDAFQGIIIGTRYGLTRYPAVVFNQGASVVYGVTDINKAVALYHQWGGEK